MADHIPPFEIMRSNLVSLRTPITDIAGCCARAADDDVIVHGDAERRATSTIARIAARVLYVGKMDGTAHIEVEREEGMIVCRLLSPDQYQRHIVQ